MNRVNCNDDVLTFSNRIDTTVEISRAKLTSTKNINKIELSSYVLFNSVLFRRSRCILRGFPSRID